MKLLQFWKEDKVCLGILNEKNIIDVEEAASKLAEKLPLTMDELVVSGQAGLNALKTMVEKVKKET